MPDTETYSPGQWVVHRHHGVGKIAQKETKRIGAKANTYYKIKTYNSTIWLPVEKANSEWLRPLATPSEIKAAQKILGSSPVAMASSLNSRKSRIQKVDSSDKPAVIAKLVRDLSSLRKVKKGLSQTEEASLRRFADCLLAEWSACMGIEVDEARIKFEKLLAKGQAKGIIKIPIEGEKPVVEASTEVVEALAKIETKDETESVEAAGAEAAGAEAADKEAAGAETAGKEAS